MRSIHSLSFSASFILILCACSSNTDSLPQDINPGGNDIIYNLNGDPVIQLLSPSDNFVIGSALAMGVDPSAESVSLAGFVRVKQNSGVAPQVTVQEQNMPAQDVPALKVTSAVVCATISGWECYSFVKQLSLGKGSYQISINASDSENRQSTMAINGVVDYCRIEGKDNGVLAEIQDDVNAPQGNRCHEIDGCSVYLTENDPLATSETRNDPSVINNSMALASTAFGNGTLPKINEYFVHGRKPNDDLPCNNHDVCYQTTASNKDNCDRAMQTAMNNVCAAAYPEDGAPPASDTVARFEWDGQKTTCFGFSDTYYNGVRLGGASSFDQRKIDYAP